MKKRLSLLMTLGLILGLSVLETNAIPPRAIPPRRSLFSPEKLAELRGERPPSADQGSYSSGLLKFLGTKSWINAGIVAGLGIGYYFLQQRREQQAEKLQSLRSQYKTTFSSEIDKDINDLSPAMIHARLEWWEKHQDDIKILESASKDKITSWDAYEIAKQNVLRQYFDKFKALPCADVQISKVISAINYNSNTGIAQISLEKHRLDQQQKQFHKLSVEQQQKRLDKLNELGEKHITKNGPALAELLLKVTPKNSPTLVSNKELCDLIVKNVIKFPELTAGGRPVGHRASAELASHPQ